MAIALMVLGINFMGDGLRDASTRGSNDPSAGSAATSVARPPRRGRPGPPLLEVCDLRT